MSHKSQRDGRVRLTALRVEARVAVMLFSICVSAQEITVAAAADLSTALPEIAAAYTKQTGEPVKLSFGSSGNLTNQILNGAPFDVFFSADESYPAQVIEKSLAQKDSLYRYAVGRLVLWIPNELPLDVQAALLHFGSYEV